MQYKSQAPGKVIISGEHAVVYGYPALAATVDLYTIAEAKPKKGKGTGFELSVTSNIPPGSGLGFSASVSAATTLVVLKFLRKKASKELLNEVVFGLEKGVHGMPSGIDNTTVVYGGFIKFLKMDEKFKFSRLKPKKVPQFILINSGKPQETTKDMLVKIKAAQDTEIIEKIGKIGKKFIANFEKGKFNPELVRENQRLLDKLGVVGKKAREIVHSIEGAGGVAKVCGAGGVKQGSGILLAWHPQIEKINTLAKRNRWEHFFVKLGVEGAK